MLISDKQHVKESRDLALPLPLAAPTGQPGPILPSTKSDVDFLDSLQRRWFLAAAIFIAITAAGYWGIRHLLQVTYQAEATVYVSPSALRDNAEQVNEVSYVNFINHQILKALHYDTLSAALRGLDASGHPWKRAGETEQAAIERLRHTINAWRVPDSYEITIAATGPDPKDLANIANAVAHAYLDKGAGEFVSERADRLAALTKENAFVQNQLNEKVKDVAQYSGKLQVVDLERASTFPDDAVLAQMRVALAGAHQKRIEAQQQMAVDEKSNAAAEAEQIVMNDGALRTMMDALLQRKTDLRTHLDGMLPANPLYRSTQKELSGIDNELRLVPAEMIRTVGSQLMDKRRTDLEQSKRIETALSNEIDQRVSDMETASRDLREARSLNADVDRLVAHLRDVQQRIDALNLQSQMPGFLSIFSIAQRPLHPLKNQKQKAAGAVLVLALFLSLVVPVALDALDPHIHNPASVERIMGFLPVGMTIEWRAGGEEFADEHLRRVASAIQRCVAHGAKTVLLAPLKFGATDILVGQVAKILAERGCRPLLVHANRQMVIPNTIEHLAGRAQFSALGRYFSRLKATEQDCDVVLVSTPPLLLSSDTELLATEADVTLMVVEAARSSRKDLERAGRLLERLRVAGVGVILTRVRIERGGRTLKSDLRDYLKLRTVGAGSPT